MTRPAHQISFVALASSLERFGDRCRKARFRIGQKNNTPGIIVPGEWFDEEVSENHLFANTYLRTVEQHDLQGEIALRVNGLLHEIGNMAWRVQNERLNFVSDWLRLLADKAYLAGQVVRELDLPR